VERCTAPAASADTAPLHARNALALADAVVTLTKQLDDLTSQFHGFSSVSSTSTLLRPNDPTLASDFAHASSVPASSSAAASKKAMRTASPAGGPGAVSKSVRFTTDSPSNASPSPPPIHTPASTVEDSGSGGVNPLFAARYRDNPALADETEGYRDHVASQDLSNQQIHAYHDQILRQQDDQLDALGASISRQRELGLRMGDELDDQVALLEEQEGLVDRHQTRIDRARRQVGRIAKAAGDSKQMVIIAVLVVILVFLIIVLK
jgi:syntaxin 8